MVEDGSIVKNYFIYVIRLFVSDVFFIDFKFFVFGSFFLDFVLNIISYFVFVLFSCFFVEVKFSVVDKKIVVKVNGGELKDFIFLNYGEMVVEVEVIFLDLSNK